MNKRNKLINLSLVLILGSFFLLGDGEKTGGEETMVNPTPRTNPMSIYPKQPVVAKDGSLKLLPVITEQGAILEDSDEHTLYATYQVKDENILTVSSLGDVTGVNPGETEVTISIEDKNTSKTYTNKVNIKVAVVDISKLFLNPDVSALKKGENKEFILTALDSDKSATLIEGQYMKFDYQNDQINLIPKITNETSTIKVTAKQQKGYTFIIPTFEKAGITVTGDPTLIQFTSTPQSNAPSGASAGEDIDFIRIKNGSGDDLYVVHTGDDILYFESFKHAQGKWSRQILDVDGSRVEYPKIYQDDIGLHVVVLSDKKLYELTSTNGGTNWSKTKLFDEDFTISSPENIDVMQIQGETLLAIASGDVLSLYKIIENSPKTLFSLNNIKDIKSIALTSNQDNKFRMVFSDKNGITYITEQNNKYYMKQIIEDSNAKKVKIAYNKYNSPTIMYYKDEALKEVEKTTTTWSTASISGLKFGENGLSTDALQDIRDFDFVIDRYGNSRIIVADDEKLYYIKEYGDKNQKDWRIDKVIEKNVGNSVSLTIDNKSRLKAIFQNLDTEWIKYWAEPVYVKYRDKSSQSKVSDELNIDSSTVKEIP